MPFVILALLTAVFLYPFVRTFAGAPDFGVFLNGADLINHGAVPSRDFVEPQGPGSFVWLALVFRIFGTNLIAARNVLIATGVGMGLLTFYLSRKLGATGVFASAFVIAVSIPLLPVNSPHYDSNLVALAALALFLIVWDDAVKGNCPSIWAVILSALLCGVTTSMIQQKGLYLAVAFILCLLRTKAWRSCIIFAFAFLLTTLLPFTYFAAAHALPDVWFANFVWPLQTYSELNASSYGFPAWKNFEWLLQQHAHQHALWLFDIAIAVPFAAIAGLPLLLPLAAHWTGQRWFTLPMLPYWLAAYALWFAELHRMDIGHLRNGVVLLAMLFFSMCETSQFKSLRYLGFVLTICLTIACTLNFAMAWQITQTQQTRHGEIFVKQPEPLLDFLDTHTKAGDEVFVYPYQPIYYFFEKLKNPTRYSYLQYHFNSDAQFHEVVNDLERKKVRYVIVDSELSGERIKTMFPAYKHPSKSKLILEPYLDSHYRMVKDLGRFHVLERRL